MSSITCFCLPDPHQSADFVQYFTLAKESSDFLKSIYNTVYYVLLSVPTQIALALIIAMFLNKNIAEIPFQDCLFHPFCYICCCRFTLCGSGCSTTSLDCSTTFFLIFNLPRIAWLKDEVWTIPTIAIVSVWQHVGYTTVISFLPVFKTSISPITRPPMLMGKRVAEIQVHYLAAPLGTTWYNDNHDDRFCSRYSLRSLFFTRATWAGQQKRIDPCILRI